MKKNNDFNHNLQDSNFKLTKQRQIILNVLKENSHKHLTMEEIHDLLLQSGKKVGIATVYRNVELFEEANLVSKINLDDGYGRYQFISTQEKHEHHHLICERCGKIIDMQDDYLDILEKKVFDQYGFKVTNHKVKLYGICKECLKDETTLG